MQIELLNRGRWRTNLELAVAMADHIEHSSNPARRHSALDYLTKTNATIYVWLNPRPHCHKRAPPNGVKRMWSTKWGLGLLVGLAGIEPATEGL
jgi:hypothetical protein